MSMAPNWWGKPRRISVIVDNDSWILPFSEDLVSALGADGDDAVLCRTHGQVSEGVAAFYLGCTTITPPDVLARNRRNLVVHESDLPEGRGFSPLTWQVLEGKNEIPVCLLEAVDRVDAGPVVYRDRMTFEGHELIEEMRDVLGRLTIALCRRFMAEDAPPHGERQQGEVGTYPRRTRSNSRMDPEQTLAQQFDLLRVVDNLRYPAFFDFRGHRYHIQIEKGDPDKGGDD